MKSKTISVKPWFNYTEQQTVSDVRHPCLPFRPLTWDIRSDIASSALFSRGHMCSLSSPLCHPVAPQGTCRLYWSSQENLSCNYDFIVDMNAIYKSKT